MATDNSPPRLKLLVTIGVITVVTLVALNLVLRGYYAHMSDEARHAKMAPTTGLDDHRKSEMAILAGSKVPMDQAMAQLARGQRDNLIAPQQSDDLGPMTGWSKAPKAPPEAPGADAGAAKDGGVHAAGDAGAPATNAADAGAKADGGADAMDAGAKHAAGSDAGVDAGAGRRAVDAGARHH
ncbi:MAG: hypothetical protein FWD69_10760 [Polyangiaceae bacterium]|nr:hypothetical protein [Polyangiaceae bacterium]